MQTRPFLALRVCYTILLGNVFSKRGIPLVFPVVFASIGKHVTQREERQREREGGNHCVRLWREGWGRQQKAWAASNIFSLWCFPYLPRQWPEIIAGNCVYRYGIDAIVYWAIGFASGSPLVRFVNPAADYMRRNFDKNFMCVGKSQLQRLRTIVHTAL